MITKRTQNAAHIRFNVINYVLEMCKYKDFSKVHVTEICQASAISKVTFFKYFDRKEDVLMLYKSIINTSICIEVSQRQLKSIDGLELVINRFVNMVSETPSIARELVSTILHTQSPILPIILTEADKAVFFPEIHFPNINLLSFWDLVEGFMLEAVLIKDITKMSNSADLATMFIANLYGAIVASHIKSQDQQAVVFGNSIKNWLRCLS